MLSSGSAVIFNFKNRIFIQPLILCIRTSILSPISNIVLTFGISVYVTGHRSLCMSVYVTGHRSLCMSVYVTDRRSLCMSV